MTWNATLQKAVNQSCIDSHVWAVVEKSCPRAFDGCAKPLNRSEPCYVNAFMESLSGSKGCRRMDLQPLLEAWQGGWERDDPEDGGCPPVTDNAVNRVS